MRLRSGFGTALLFSTLLAAMVFPIAPTHAAGTTYYVGTLADTLAAADCLTLTNTTCTLRDALAVATSGSDTIQFRTGLSGTLTLDPALGTLILTTNVTLTGPGASVVAIDGGCTNCEAGQSNPTGGVRVLLVNSGVTTTISGLTVQHGNAGTNDSGGGIRNRGTLTVADSVVTGNSGGAGAGIASGGTLTVINSTLRVNNAIGNGGGGIAAGTGLLFVVNSRFYGNAADYGGAIATGGSGATSITNSVLSGNYSQDGGAIYSTQQISVDRSTFSGNFVTGGAGEGGGISVINNDSLSVTNSTFMGNRAVSGGGIRLYYSTGTVTNTTFDGNTAMGGNGGGIYTHLAGVTVNASTFTGNSAGGGGGIYNKGGVLTLTNSTITGNTGSASAGGVGNDSVTQIEGPNTPGSATITFSTLSNNATPSIYGGDLYTSVIATTTLSDSIIAASPGSTSSCYTYTAMSYSGTLVDNGHNLQYGDATPQCGTNATDIVGQDPKLGPLADHGGPTLTLALLPGSPAIDTGGTSCPASDQRGVPRPQGVACDIGAVEYEGVRAGGVPHATAGAGGGVPAPVGATRVAMPESAATPTPQAGPGRRGIAASVTPLPASATPLPAPVHR